jgi:hypothetical protein
MVVVAVWRGVGIILVEPDRDVKRGEEIQDGEAQCPRAQEERDEGEKETSAKARARSDRSVAASLGRFRRHEEGDASEEEKETGARAGSLAAAENSRRRSIKSRQNQRHD